ncbi:MAG: amidohydrolase [Candidatus Rokubacteria bacterium]|nr:amidohydrolase [Candidatus Rokubacteria bacterium]
MEPRSTPADLRIDHAEWLLTLDRARRIVRDGAVAVGGGRIVAVGKTAEVAAAHPAARVIDGSGKVVTPGLIDSHIHTTFQLSRGLADEVGSKRFLFERMYPYEGALDEDDARASIELAVLELLRNGVTSFIDAGNYQPHLTAEVVGGAGMRGVVARSTFDVTRSALGVLPPAFIESTAEALEHAEAVVRKLDGAYQGRVRAWFQFRGLNNSTDRLIVDLKALADRYGVGLQTHACFARDTREASLAQHGVAEIERLERLGVLGPNVLLVHAGWATDHELEQLRQHDVKVVAAPSSSLHNAYGNIVQGHVPELLEAGVAVGIGSDHASSGIVDLCQEMFLAACAYKEARENPEVMPPERVLEMATVNGARCMLADGDVGALEPGKQADLVLFDTARPEWQPLYNPVANLVYSATGKSVDTVIVGGKLLVQGGRALTLDEDAIIERARRRAPEILRKTGLAGRVAPRWPVA